VPRWQRCGHVTDSSAEQRLEVGVRAGRRVNGNTWKRVPRERVRSARGNGKGATAVVTRYGCGRGEFFEGYETRRGKGGAPAHRRRWGGADVRKRGEPQDRQRDATSPRLHDSSAPARGSGRRKPSRRCNTARTEQDVQAWQPWTRSRVDREVGEAGVDAREHVDGGETRNPREEADYPARAIGSSSEGERRPRGDVHHRLRW
jgi:hypothetical protein